MGALMTRQGLAIAYLATGRGEAAITLLKTAVAGGDQLLGNEHPYMLNRRNNLAFARLSRRQPEEAIPLLERNIADAERLFGVDDPHILFTHELLAGAHLLLDCDAENDDFGPHLARAVGCRTDLVFTVPHLDDHSESAATGSGLLSLDNNDRTARNARDAYARHGVSQSDVVHWDVVPFPVSGLKNGGSTPAERQRDALWNREVVELLPALEIVLMPGAAVRDGWRRGRSRSAGRLRGARQNSTLLDARSQYGRGRAVLEEATETVAGLLLIRAVDEG